MSLKGAVEAALFAAGGPIQLKDLAQLVGSPPGDVEEMLGGGAFAPLTGRRRCLTVGTGP